MPMLAVGLRRIEDPADFGPPAFRYFVGHIVGIRSQEQMGDLAAGWIITAMENVHPLWDGARG